MAQAPQQFTPAQILEAGQRAEADGRTEYALQFYRHLTDHLPRTQEAAAAREAIARLNAGLPTDSANAIDSLHGAASNGTRAHHGPEGHPAPSGQAGRNGQPSSRARPSGGMQAGAAPQSQGTRPPPQRQGSISVAPVPDAHPRGPGLSRKRRKRYRAGRAIAALIGTFGLVQIAAGLVFVVGSIPGLLPAVAAPYMSLGPVAGGGLVAGGLFQVFAAQLARAIFDSASASRDLAAIAWARAARDGSRQDDDFGAD